MYKIYTFGFDSPILNIFSYPLFKKLSVFSEEAVLFIYNFYSICPPDYEYYTKQKKFVFAY